VSARGTHPNGAQSEAVNAAAVTVSTGSSAMGFLYAGRMDVRSIEAVAPVVEHNGTVPVWWLVSPREMEEITAGGHLELVSEFEVAGGGFVDPHSHPTHEFYYVTAGRGLMTIGDESREIAQGDLVHIPPDAVHSLRPVSDHAPIHCFCFAVAVAGAGAIDYTTH
jgi:quercetin dioxygenase-like cupin family protein